MHRSMLALVVVVALVLGACSSSSHSSASSAPPSSSPPSSTTATTSSAAWTGIDHALDAMGPRVGFLAARVSTDGTCVPIHAIAPSTPRPTASQFKLFVLGALANQIAAGRISWNQVLTAEPATRSLGNGPGSLEFALAGTRFSVEATATSMISISDNTAADMLIGLVGRTRVEAQARAWSSHASLDQPFLKTREMFLLHYVPGLANRYLATAGSGRAAFLASVVDPLSLGAVAAGLSPDPRFVDTVEWFASPADICRAFVGLQHLSKQAALAPLSTVLSRELGTIGLDRSEWPTIFFKGGSEPGVLTLGWLATNSRGETFVVQAMVSNPDTALTTRSITDLVALARRAFGLVAPT
jgi:hypothetical protein